MARQQKVGLEYFPFDVDFFSDDKVIILETKHGPSGSAIYIKILTELYKVGYCYKFGALERQAFCIKTRTEEKLLNAVLETLFEIGAFSASVFNETGLLTSKGVQTRYFEACVRRAKISVYENVLLIAEDDLPANVELADSYYLDKSKVKESKVKIATSCKHDVDNLQQHVAETPKKAKSPRKKFNPDGKTKYLEWVYLSDEQFEEVKKYYKSRGHDQDTFEDAVELLNAWFANNQHQRKKYTDDAAILKGWPLREALKTKTESLKAEAQEDYAQRRRA